MRLWALLNKASLSSEEVVEATYLQAVLSKADVAAVPGGIRAMSKSTCCPKKKVMEN